MSCDLSFVTMSRTSWSTVNQVSGPSPYTDELVKSAEQLVVVIKPLVEQKKYLKNFFDKACRSVFMLHPFMARQYSPTAQCHSCQVHKLSCEKPTIEGNRS